MKKPFEYTITAEYFYKHDRIETPRPNLLHIPHDTSRAAWPTDFSTAMKCPISTARAFTNAHELLRHYVLNNTDCCNFNKGPPGCHASTAGLLFAEPGARANFDGAKLCNPN